MSQPQRVVAIVSGRGLLRRNQRFSMPAALRPSGRKMGVVRDIEVFYNHRAPGFDVGQVEPGAPIARQLSTTILRRRR